MMGDGVNRLPELSGAGEKRGHLWNLTNSAPTNRSDFSRFVPALPPLFLPHQVVPFTLNHKISLKSRARATPVFISIMLIHYTVKYSNAHHPFCTAMHEHIKTPVVESTSPVYTGRVHQALSISQNLTYHPTWIIKIYRSSSGFWAWIILDCSPLA